MYYIELMERFNEWMEPHNHPKRGEENMNYHINLYVYNLIFINATEEFTKFVHEQRSIFKVEHGDINTELFNRSIYEACRNRNKQIFDIIFGADEVRGLEGINEYGGMLDLLYKFIEDDNAEALDFLLNSHSDHYQTITFESIYNIMELYTSPKIYEYLLNTFIKNEFYDIIGNTGWRDDIFYSFDLFSDKNELYHDMSILDDFVNIGYPKRFDIDDDKNIGVVLIKLLYGPEEEFGEIDFEGDADIGENITWENVVLMFEKDYAAIVRYVYTKISDHFRHMGVVPFVPYPAVMRLLSSVDTIQQSYRTSVKTD